MPGRSSSGTRRRPSFRKSSRRSTFSSNSSVSSQYPGGVHHFQTQVRRVQPGHQARRGHPVETRLYATFHQRIQEYTERARVARRRRGRAAEQLDLGQGHYPGADFPNTVWQIDHTKLDLILVDDLHREPVGRPWITLVMDVCSRAVMGFYVSFDAPSAFSVGMAMAHAILQGEVAGAARTGPARAAGPLPGG